MSYILLKSPHFYDIIDHVHLVEIKVVVCNVLTQPELDFVNIEHDTSVNFLPVFATGVTKYRVDRVDNIITRSA